MDKASAYGAGDCRFESYRGQCCGRAAFSSRRQASSDRVVGGTCNLVAAGDAAVPLEPTCSGGPVAQWIRYRPTEPGIVGSSPTGVNNGSWMGELKKLATTGKFHK